MTRISKALRPPFTRSQGLLNATFDFVIKKLIRVSNYAVWYYFMRASGPMVIKLGNKN